MSVVGDNIRALRMLYGEGREITQGELADIVGVTRETVNKWEAGTISDLRTSNINRLREYFGLSVDDLRSESRGLASRLHVQLGTLESATEKSERCYLPLRNWEETICGEETHIETPAHVYDHHPKAFAYVMHDGSMSNIFPAGCHLVVDPDVVPQSGSIALISLVNGSDAVMVRRIHRGAQKLMLTADGPTRMDDLVFEASEVRVHGTIVWYQAAFELE